VLYSDHLHQYDNAVADFSKVLELSPRNTNAWCSRGQAYRRSNQLEKALADYSRALELNSKLAPAWVGRGLVHATLGRHVLAIADFSKGCELKSPLAHDRLAWLLATCADPAIRNPGRAVAAAKQALKMEPENRAYWRTLAWAHYRAGDWQLAVTAIEHARELGSPGNSLEWFLLALAYSQLGNADGARQWYDQGTAWMDRHQPDDDVLRRFRAEAADMLGLKQN
jgi:tetratricopeptide (TPR) repeat protein